MQKTLGSGRGRLAPTDHAERSRLAFRRRSVFQGSLYRPLTLSQEYLAPTLPLGSRKVACLSADKIPLQARKGSSLQASSHSPNRSSLVTKRNTILRA
jgi:hypothetical protein